MITLQHYRWLTSLISPLLRLWLWLRIKRGKEDAQRIHERYGIATRARPQGNIIWLHGASVGECQLALNMIHLIHPLLTSPQTSIFLITSGTRTSAELVQRFQARHPHYHLIHQFHPLDVAAWVNKFLAHWQPSIALVMESELWPLLWSLSRQQGCKLALINAALSAKSAQRWQQFAPKILQQMLQSFDLIVAQSADDAARFSALTTTTVHAAYNLKLLNAPLAIEQPVVDALKAMIGDRPVWIAASTHSGEDEQVAAAHKQLLAVDPSWLCIIVPRHPVRGSTIAALLRQQQFNVATRSKLEAITPATQIYIADTLGELGHFYQMSRYAFMAGSWAMIGGHNILEPMPFGCIVLHGPQMHRQQPLMDLVRPLSATLEVDSPTALATTILQLHQNAHLRQAQLDAQQRVLNIQHNLLPQYEKILTPWIRGEIHHGT